MNKDTRHPWTFDDLILVLDWMRNGPGGEPSSELLALTSPHSKESVKAQIRNFEFLDPMIEGGLPNKSWNAEWVWRIFMEEAPKWRLRFEARRIARKRRA